MIKPIERSPIPITNSDLRQLLSISREYIDSFFHRRRDLRHYKKQLVSIALCQGAALHYLDKKNGVKDFDIYFFFGVEYDNRLINRVPAKGEINLSKFGVHPDDYQRGLTARRIDFLRRNISPKISVIENQEPEIVIRSYLEAKPTPTATELAKKAVIGLWPTSVFAKTIWPTD